MDDFSGAQHGAAAFGPAVLAVGLTRGAGGELLADVFWQGDAAAGAGVAVDAGAAGCVLEVRLR